MRAASFDDLPTLVDLARCYHAEAHSQLPFDEGHVRDQLLTRTVDTIDGICLKLESNGQIAGFLAATTSLLFSAPVRAAIELAWYVHPDHRGKGETLLDSFEEWGRWKGCWFCALGMNELPSAARSEALARLYRRRGYYCFERSFMKDIRA